MLYFKAFGSLEGCLVGNVIVAEGTGEWKRK